MTRPRLNTYILKNDFNQIVKSLKSNNLFVCQLEDGVLVAIERDNNFLNGIMINPKNYEKNGFTRWNFDFDGLKNMYEEILNDKKNTLYNVEIGEHRMIDVLPSLTDALTCLKNNSNYYKGYRLRKFN
jgi:hypothetical protein